jgi:hypothetical protein
MQPQWFYFREGKSHGPVTMAEVRRMLKCERLKPTDYVRYFQDAEWMLVSDFLEMLARSARDLGEDDEGEAAAEEPESAGEPSVVSALATQGSELVSESAFRAASFVSSVWEFLKRLPELRRSWITVAALALIACAYALKDVDWQLNPTQQAIDQLLAFEDELDLLQGRNTSEAEWSDFHRSVNETIVPLQKSLEERARNSPRLRSHYWTEWGYRQSVARSHLIQACLALRQMAQSRGGEESTRTNLHRRIDLAHAQTLPDPAGTGAKSAEWDVMSLGIVGLDVVLLLGGVAFWWMRRAHKMQPTS